MFSWAYVNVLKRIEPPAGLRIFGYNSGTAPLNKEKKKFEILSRPSLTFAYDGRPVLAEEKKVPYGWETVGSCKTCQKSEIHSKEYCCP